MTDSLTINAETLLWTLTSTGIVNYAHSTPHTGHSTGPYPAGPYDCIPEAVPFDPVHETGGSFWKLTSGPDSGKYVSCWTNSLGYGDVTYTGSYTPPANSDYPTINPLADWRILIKGLGDGTSTLTNTTVTINATTNRYSRSTAGLISASPLPRNTIPAGGPYKVNPIVVPYDPIWGTGGSFWRMVDGPYPGWLLSKWTNTLSDDFGPYGNITIANDASFGRGPGATIATLYHPNAHLAGFSINYNAPGELHFTLLVDDPNIGVIIPKQTHATVEFYNTGTDEWDEVWAGVVWDIDATDTEVVFYGIDYLGMLQYCVDERFDPAAKNKAAPAGSKYVDKTIKQIIDAQLDYSIALSDSWVGWITRGTTDAMNEKISAIWSTMAQTLPFVVGLIDSHRSGTGKYTRLSVQKTIGGGYEFVIEDNPGVNQDGKMLRYGDLAQGYRAIQFGKAWASRVNVISRTVNGTKVGYDSDSSGVDQGEWGRVAQDPLIIEVMDNNDLKRRIKQAALDSARMGRQISTGLKLGSFRPLEDYDICDNLPIEINHGAVATKDWASDVFGADDEADPSAVTANYWTILGISWESYDDGHWMTNLTLFPKGGGIVKPETCSLAAKEGTGDSALAPPYSGTVSHTPTFSPALLISYLAANDRDSPRASIPPTPSGFTSLYSAADWARTAHRVSYKSVLDPSGSYSTPFTYTPGYGGGGGWAAGLVAIQTGSTAPVQSAYVEGSAGPATLPAPPTAGNILVACAASAAFNGDCYPGAPYASDWTRVVYEKITADQTDLQMGIWVKCVNEGDAQSYYWDKNSGYGSDIGFYLSEWAITTGIDVASPIVVPVPLTTGFGPPPATTTSDTYTDQNSGVVYERNDDTETYDAVAGTGSVVDFDFTASTEWVINHTFSGYPRVTLTDTSGALIEADVVYTSTSVITVTLSSAVAGKAHLG